MHRPTIAIVAIVLLALSLGLQLAGSSDPYIKFACLRMGAVMAALWLAHPQLTAVPRWLLIGTMVLLLIVAWRPKALVFALPIALALWLLRPRKSRTPRQ